MAQTITIDTMFAFHGTSLSQAFTNQASSTLTSQKLKKKRYFDNQIWDLIPLTLSQAQLIELLNSGTLKLLSL